ncbi:S-adenosyl-L-methionine-dependent methyltransferase [Baffinella frigidus]|nr:S-adenosyl-L-methionine-dependent methyltransferase [Cryptophyta sp. CCMP2293]
MALNTSSWEYRVKTSHPGIWQECLETPTLEANQEVYQRWHTSYDADLLSHGYSAPAQASPKQAASDLEAAIKNMSAKEGQKAAEWSIIDVGAGTGLVGQELARRGFTNLTALDSSKEMLAQAERKCVYKRLIVADANDVPRPIRVRGAGAGVGGMSSQASAVLGRAYDAAISVGTFTPAGSIDAVVSYLREGGLFAFTSRVDFFEDEEAGFGARL